MHNNLHKQIKNELGEEKKVLLKIIITKIVAKKTEQAICHLANIGQIMYHLYVRQVINQS